MLQFHVTAYVFWYNIIFLYQIPFDVKLFGDTEPDTVSFTDLDHCKQADYFESILTTFKPSFIFWGSWGSGKNLLELIIKPPV